MHGAEHCSNTSDISFTEIGDDFVRATMPVDQRTRQPHGLLHGGASVALAETLGSMGATCASTLRNLCAWARRSTQITCVRRAPGWSRPPRAPVHLGGRTHVWSIDIVNEARQIGLHVAPDRGRHSSAAPWAVRRALALVAPKAVSSRHATHSFRNFVPGLERSCARQCRRPTHPHPPPRPGPLQPAPNVDEQSYLLGLSFGEQMHSLGITDQLSTEAISRGLKDGLQGKKITPADRAQVQEYMRGR